MKIDRSGADLKEAAQAHAARLASPPWAPSNGKDDSWLDSIASAKPAPSPSTGGTQAQPMSQDFEPDESSPASDPHREAQGPAFETLSDRAAPWRSAGSDAWPGWLELAAGNPHTYDAPDPTRMGVFARVRPATYDRLRLVQQRIGLRTTAGAWEFLLRLGLAAAERLPAR